MPNLSPISESGLFKKKRPPNLTLTLNPPSVISPSNSLKPFSSNLQPCTTPEVKVFIKELIGNLDDFITYTNHSIKSGENGLVKQCTLFFSSKNKIFTLVKKQGGTSVAREIKITNAIKNTTSLNFPYHLCALPIFQNSNQTINFFYTSYRKLGDLEKNMSIIQEKLQLEDSTVLCTIFRIVYQLVTILDALHNSKFTDEQGGIHEGIIHNDIKPDNIFLKENDEIELADFGCAYYKDEPASQFSTYYFIAPEIWNNSEFCKAKIKNIDKADIWSLGATLMYILKNKRIIGPSEKPDNEFEKILIYKTWAENYSAYWEKLNLEINSHAVTSLKHLLEYLALLMLAPVELRPDAKNLKNKLEAIKPIIDRKPKNFYSTSKMLM